MEGKCLVCPSNCKKCSNAICFECYEGY